MNYQIVIIGGSWSEVDSVLPIGIVVSQDDNNIVITVPKQYNGENPVAVILIGKAENVNVTIHLADAAKFHLISFFNESSQQQITTVNQSRDSEFYHYHISLAADNLSHQIQINLQQQGASCELNGIYLLNNKNTSTHDIIIDHQSQNTRSKQFYKGILDGESQASFRGKVIVAKDAQQIEAHQSNHNLLLSQQAQVATRPELEIYADDVKCSHGATIGQLDDDALFYLRSRGIEDNVARQMLTQGFIQDVLHRFPLSVQQQLSAQHPMLEVSNEHVS